jgi:hypothetical protein
MNNPSASSRRNVPVESRRQLLRTGVAGGIGLSVFGGPTAIAASSGGAVDGFGPLLPPDQNGLRLPAGFVSRVIATSGQVVPGTSHVWHADPDGGATFATADGGWVYASNAERGSGLGGVGAVRFDAAGTVINAYTILSGTTRNCAGGPTPWGTWLSCEETTNGEVYECDPYSPGSQGVKRPLMGKFQHEAAAVDPTGQVIYLTEDRSDSLLYRFIPSSYPDLSSGTLQAAQILGSGSISLGQVRDVVWLPVPDPTVSLGVQTRFQVPSATRFNGGEGAWYEQGAMHFTTKGDNRVWKLDTVNQRIQIVYQASLSPTPELTGVDNVFVTPCGDVLVAEDGGNMQIVALTPSGKVTPVVWLPSVTGSEITGPALSPDGTRLYFSSQRNPGRTYEVKGPWLGITSLPVPASSGLAAAVTAAAMAGAGALLLRREELARANRLRQA